MKEVLTKSFWKDVKKTFQEARDGVAGAEKEQVPAGEKDSGAQAERDLSGAPEEPPRTD